MCKKSIKLANKILSFILFFSLTACGGGGGGGGESEPSEPSNTDNSAPIANAGSDQTTIVNNTITLNGTSSSDSDGDILLYSWTLVSSPTGSAASLVDSAESIASLTLDEVGEYLISLVVNDGSEDSTADSITVVATEYTGSGAITLGLGTATTTNLFPSGVRPSPIGVVNDLTSTSWTVPADVNYQNSDFPVASDLYNPHGDQYANELTALAGLDSNNIIEIGAAGELITAYIYADNYFEMYINGVSVGKDPVPFTDFNSSLIQFRVSLPFTVAMLLVDWEEDLGTGTEDNGGANRPGDGGMAAVFKDSTNTIIGITDESWLTQTYYTSPITDLSCLTESNNQRLSAGCPTTSPTDLSVVYGVHWALDTDWMAEDYDDSLWPNATTYTNNEIGVNRAAYTNFTNVFDDNTDDAQFIWSTNLILDNEVVVRKIIGN